MGIVCLNYQVFISSVKTPFEVGGLHEKMLYTHGKSYANWSFSLLAFQGHWQQDIYDAQVFSPMDCEDLLQGARTMEAMVCDPYLEAVGESVACCRR